jgi:hypothetical protein
MMPQVHPWNQDSSYPGIKSARIYKEVCCDSLRLRAGQDEEVERSTVMLPGRKSDHLPVVIFPEDGIMTLVDSRGTEPPGEVNDVATGKGHAVYEIENTRQINLAAKWMAGNAHDENLLPHKLQFSMPYKSPLCHQEL